MSKHNVRDARGCFVSSKPLTVTEQSITVSPAAEVLPQVPRLTLVPMPVEQTMVSYFDRDGNVEMQDVYSSFPVALVDALGHRMVYDHDGEDFDVMRCGEVGPLLRFLVPDTARAPIGWDFADFERRTNETQQEINAEMASMSIADDIDAEVERIEAMERREMADALADICPPTCTCCDDEPYAEMTVVVADPEVCTTRDRRRETYARAIAAVAGMPGTLQASRKVKSLLYLVESRTNDSATENGIQQAERAADELCALAVAVV